MIKCRLVRLTCCGRIMVDTMKITIKLFASFREAAGISEAALEIAPGLTAADLWADLVSQHPRLFPLSRNAGMAVNGRYIQPATLLSEGDVVAFLPPVSGG
jgi:molybdopterin converting factor subunit 1